MKGIEKIKKDPVYKKIMDDSFGGVMYNVENHYKGDHLLKIWNELPASEKEFAGGIVKGAMGFLKEQKTTARKPTAKKPTAKKPTAKMTKEQLKTFLKNMYRIGFKNYYEFKENKEHSTNIIGEYIQLFFNETVNKNRRTETQIKIVYSKERKSVILLFNRNGLYSSDENNIKGIVNDLRDKSITIKTGITDQQGNLKGINSQNKTMKKETKKQTAKKPKNEVVELMTKEQWNKTPKDYKTTKNGVRYVLRMTDKGTATVPVKMVETKKPTAKKPATKKPTAKSQKRTSAKKLLESSDIRNIGLGFVYETKKNLANAEKTAKAKRVYTRQMNIIRKGFDTLMNDADKKSLAKMFKDGAKRSILGQAPTKTDGANFAKLYDKYKGLGANPTKKKDPKDIWAKIESKL